jgi:hypothetical protein
MRQSYRLLVAALTRAPYSAGHGDNDAAGQKATGVMNDNLPPEVVSKIAVARQKQASLEREHGAATGVFAEVLEKLAAIRADAVCRSALAHEVGDETGAASWRDVIAVIDAKTEQMTARHVSQAAEVSAIAAVVKQFPDIADRSPPADSPALPPNVVRLRSGDAG